ncbi:unnamed protein product [Ambrosiozyma monospora]|uniref:Unnamed protein product n=1 Tax=Ambrosiozyma monospora TaxID=43982 RepID=A0ACB5TDA8_AMBMO|nr:unnamed protein product [Ambrosiozyma monospora]
MVRTTRHSSPIYVFHDAQDPDIDSLLSKVLENSSVDSRFFLYPQAYPFTEFIISRFIKVGTFEISDVCGREKHSPEKFAIILKLLQLSEKVMLYWKTEFTNMDPEYLQFVSNLGVMSNELQIFFDLGYFFQMKRLELFICHIPDDYQINTLYQHLSDDSGDWFHSPKNAKKHRIRLVIASNNQCHYLLDLLDPVFHNDPTFTIEYGFFGSTESVLDLMNKTSLFRSRNSVHFTGRPILLCSEIDQLKCNPDLNSFETLLILPSGPVPWCPPITYVASVKLSDLE